MSTPSPTPNSTTTVPTPTPTSHHPVPAPASAPPTNIPTPEPTPAPTSDPPTDTPTSAPPTSAPPTSAPPTDPPTAAPPTDTPTSAPPTSDPPTSAPPTDTPVSPAPPPKSRAPSPSTTSEPVPASTPSIDASSPEPPTSKRPRDDDAFNTITSAPSVNVAKETIDEDDQKKDVIVFESKQPSTKDPVAVPNFNKETNEPSVLDLGNTETEAPKKFVRGQDQNEDKSETTNEPNVIGGRKRGKLPANTESRLSESTKRVYDFLKYASCTFAGISVALLLFFHYVSLDATLSWTGSIWSPNTWEFLFYVAFLQQMSSISQLSLSQAPYYLLEYTDSFSWTNFLLHGSSPSSSSDSRRLETIILEGVVSYADRIGISESKILFRCIVGFALIVGILLAIFFFIAILAKIKAEQLMEETSNSSFLTLSGKVQRLRSASIRTLGLCVLLWFFALYPLSLFSSYEIAMEVKAKQVADPLSVAIIALIVICFGVLSLSGRIILHKSLE
jgi:hypothetical protein